MNILANVSSSLMGDYNEIVDYFGSIIGGDKYFSTTLLQGKDIHIVNFSDYDLIVNFIDDDDDIMDAYDTLLKYAIDNGKTNNFIAYYKCRDFYTSNRVYFAKKDANRKRLHRFLNYDDTDEIVFDVMMFASVYFGANISVKDGMLRFKDYDVIDLGGVRFLANNSIINGYYKKITMAREEENLLISTINIDNENVIHKLNKVRFYLKSLYDEYDDRLRCAIALYSGIIYSFGNKLMPDLDYIFSKEYFEIGHYSSICSCFNRNSYVNLPYVDDDNFDDAISIMKMMVYSMSFGENNNFVNEIIKRMFKGGKELEKRVSKDRFFYKAEHYFYIHIGEKDEDNKIALSYIDAIENGSIVANNKNALDTYLSLSNQHLKASDFNKANDYANKALKYADSSIDKVKVYSLLFELSRMLADVDKQREYASNILSYSDVIDNGYHNQYSRSLYIIMNAMPHFDENRYIDIIDRLVKNSHLDKENKYILSLNKMFLFDTRFSINERIEGIKSLTYDMIEDFYINPTLAFLWIYNSLLVLADLYEEIGEDDNSAICYKRAYSYAMRLERLDTEYSEQLAYAQYKLGDKAIDMDSATSYKQLAKSEKRMHQRIVRTGKYIDFYGDLLYSISLRFIEDKRYKVGSMIAYNHLAKLIDCCEIDKRYFIDLSLYADKMSKLFATKNMKKESEDFLRLSLNYGNICKEQNIKN